MTIETVKELYQKYERFNVYKIYKVKKDSQGNIISKEFRWCETVNKRPVYRKRSLVEEAREAVNQIKE